MKKILFKPYAAVLVLTRRAREVRSFQKRYLYSMTLLIVLI